LTKTGDAFMSQMWIIVETAKSFQESQILCFLDLEAA
jgi:hypothetical protein